MIGKKHILDVDCDPDGRVVNVGLTFLFMPANKIPQAERN